MVTGEGKTLVGAIAAAGLRAAGPARARDLRQRLPRPPRRRVDGAAARASSASPSAGSARRPSSEERRAAYANDVVYVPVNEVGFDVLRDRLVTDLDDAIVPEPDVARRRRGRLGAGRRGARAAGARGRRDAGAVDAEIVATVRRLRAGVHYETDPAGRNVAPHRAGAGPGRAPPRRHRPLHRGPGAHPRRRQRGAARARAAAPRRRLPRARRQGRAHRRLPWPRGAPAALAGRAAGRRRGQGGRSRPARPAPCSTRSWCRPWSGATARCAG